MSPVEPIDSVLPSVEIVSSVKMADDEAAMYSSTSLRRAELENRHLTSVKELSALAPNFFQPDYGSRMTSSMYVRGFGSRIDQPVVGMNVDGVPVMNKNSYDFEFFDIDRVQVLRGAQSALYGRNTSGGAINVYTLSPLNYQGKRLSLEYGTANDIRLKASHYAKHGGSFGWSVGVAYNHSDGYFKNYELGKNCDGGDNAALRFRLQWLPSENLSIDNTASLGYVDEGGWAYGAYNTETKEVAPVAYNDECSYKRFEISEGLVVKYYFDHATLSSTTGYRYMDDRMRIDNDFLPLDYFSMGQFQKEHSLTQEVVIKLRDTGCFNLMGGVFGFYKNNKMSAPVHFKQYGIENLIIKNANENYYHNLSGDRELSFKEDNFVIYDDFVIPTFGVAAFVQGGVSIGGFNVNAGLRIDYEYSSMSYDSRSTVCYSTYKDLRDSNELNTVFKGHRAVDALELLPSISVSYGADWGNVYASARKGFKAGGFNTQLFSDILQQKMMNSIVGSDDNDDDDDDIDASSTVYKPETNWTFELGTHLSPLASGNLDISASLFYIDCRNQQLTVFPPGESTGRMMSNAGRSFSAGAELSARYVLGDITFDAGFGYTHAEFVKYNRGDVDLSGKILPYAPRETYSLNVAYRLPVSRSFADVFVLNVGWNGVGRIHWNEENTLSQSFYGLLSASLVWEKGCWGASLWGKNLLNEKYNTFYFRSIGNDFFAQGKPLRFGASIHVNL